MKIKSATGIVIPGTLVILVLLLGLASVSTSGGKGLWRRSGGEIAGTVAVDGHGAVSGVRVRLDDRRSTITDHNGRFSFGLVPRGTHRLTASYRSFLYQGETPVRVKSHKLSETRIVLSEQHHVGETVGLIDEEMFPVSPLLIQDVIGYGDMVILCDHLNGFWVVDISDPGNPVLLAESPDGRNTEAAVLRWPYLYTGWNDVFAAVGGIGGIAVYSLADPAAPVKLGEVATDNVIYAVDLQGDFLYAVGRKGLHVYDVSDPAAPGLHSGLDIGRGEGVAVRDRYAFLSMYWNGALAVVDVSDKAQPREVWRAADDAGTTDVTLMGPYAYVSSSLGVLQYDVRDPGDVRLVNTVDHDYLNEQGADMTYNWLEGLMAKDASLYLGAVGDGLIVVDYSDPHRPHFAWQSNADDLVPFAMNIYADRDFAYVASRDEGFRVVRRR